MASNAISGVGTKFRRYNPATSSWEPIAEINSISGPGMSRETIDVTNLDSEDGWREFITSFRDGGEVTLSMNFTRDTYETMFNDFMSDDRKNYEILLPDDDVTTMVFAGLVTNCPWEIPMDDKITSEVTIKVSGAPQLESGSGS